MTEESTNNSEEKPEESKDNNDEQMRRIRRKLLKLGAYTGAAVITSFVASKTYAECGPLKNVCPPKAGTKTTS